MKTKLYILLTILFAHFLSDSVQSSMVTKPLPVFLSMVKSGRVLSDMRYLEQFYSRDQKLSVLYVSPHNLYLGDMFKAFYRLYQSDAARYTQKPKGVELVDIGRPHVFLTEAPLYQELRDLLEEVVQSDTRFALAVSSPEMLGDAWPSIRYTGSNATLKEFTYGNLSSGTAIKHPSDLDSIHDNRY